MKDLNCPNCGGRSYGFDDDDYYVCPLCEEPDEDFLAWYLSEANRLKAWKIWKSYVPIALIAESYPDGYGGSNDS